MLNKKERKNTSIPNVKVADPIIYNKYVLQAY